MSTCPPPTPMPIDPGDAGVLLVGGTFDPPHRAHTELPAAARDAVKPGAALLFVPAARSPHKPIGPEASDADRVAMLERACAGVPLAGVWTDEIDRARSGEPSYWVDTLHRAGSLIGGRPLGFVIGADQALALHRWRDARRIVRLASPCILLRGEIHDAATLRAILEAARFWTGDELDTLCGSVVESPLIDASSTEVRRLLKTERQHARLETLLHPGVLDFVLSNGLYG